MLCYHYLDCLIIIIIIIILINFITFIHFFSLSSGRQEMGKKRGKGKGNSNTQKSAESAAAAASPESVSPSSADPPAAAAAVEESADPVKALLDNPESVKEPESVSNPFLPSFLPSFHTSCPFFSIQPRSHA